MQSHAQTLGAAKAAVGPDDQVKIQAGRDVPIGPGHRSQQEIVGCLIGYFHQADRIRPRIMPQHGMDRSRADQMRDEPAMKAGGEEVV
jgi:hypothetical protein